MGTKRIYTRTCSCGDTKQVTYKPKEGAMCRPCSLKILAKQMSGNNVKSEKDKVRYTYTCPECGNIRVLKSKRKTELCGDCNRYSSNAVKVLVPKPRLFQICIVCSDVKEVFSKVSASKKYCDKCNPKLKEKKNKRKRTVSSEAIERVRQINREYRESIEQEEKHKSKPVPKQKIEDSEMIEKFLEKNKPSVISHPEFPHIVGEMYMSDMKEFF